MSDIDSLRQEERAIFALRSLFRGYGYQRYKMSRFEEYDLYVRNKDFLVSDEMITFTDRNGRLLAMKPDVTLSIIKNTADRCGLLQKLYYEEHVYRMPSGTDSFQEILQTGLECVGDLLEYEIQEVVLLAMKSLSLLGERFVLSLSDMGVISAILEDSGLSEYGKNRAQLYLRQKNTHEMEELCQQEMIRPEACCRLMRLITCSGSPESVRTELFPVLKGVAMERLQNLLCICRMLEECGFGDRVNVDFSVGNDMHYYSGVVFKGYLEGIPTSILSGGQYDKLLQKMGRSGRAIGFAIYVDLLEDRERKMQPERLDTLILHDGSVSPGKMIAITEQARKNGTVLVSTEEPEGQRWNHLIRIAKGEVQTDA